MTAAGPCPLATLAGTAAAVVAEALARRLHLPGERERHRQQLQQAIELANRVLADAAVVAAPAAASARATLIAAHAARACDARHGAGQLSLSAQRAPTRADCDDGWLRVEAIVAVAESSALAARSLLAELDRPEHAAACAAEAAAREARRIVAQRNHAYTFHADPAFSFGEGWYLAAAAVLADVVIQVEPGKPQTAQAESFLRDAGLGASVKPYRPRPRANKHLPDIVACAFRSDPDTAQRKLRAAFLGSQPISPAIRGWVDSRLPGIATKGGVLLWVRYGKHHPARNTSHAELVELARRVCATGLVPLLVGDALRDGDVPGAVDLTLFWKDPLFQGIDMRRAQLQFFEHLKRSHGLVGQLGVTTAGADGPALLGLPTMYLTDAPNPRLGTWVGAVPGYREMVRGDGYLDRISDGLARWATQAQPGA